MFRNLSWGWQVNFAYLLPIKPSQEKQWILLISFDGIPHPQKSTVFVKTSHSFTVQLFFFNRCSWTCQTRLNKNNNYSFSPSDIPRSLIVKLADNFKVNSRRQIPSAGGLSRKRAPSSIDASSFTPRRTLHLPSLRIPPNRITRGVSQTATITLPSLGQLINPRA